MWVPRNYGVYGNTDVVVLELLPCCALFDVAVSLEADHARAGDSFKLDDLRPQVCCDFAARQDLNGPLPEKLPRGAFCPLALWGHSGALYHVTEHRLENVCVDLMAG